MSGGDVIDAYLRELAGELRTTPWRRRRILQEVGAHLHEAAAAERHARGIDTRAAAARALERFGIATEMADQFNRVARRRGALLRRALIPWAAAAALTSVASASVWAFEPGAGATPHVARTASGVRSQTRAQSGTRATRRAKPRAGAAAARSETRPGPR